MQDRVTELEIKIAHLEQSLGELSDVLYRQQGQLDRLESSYSGLKQRVLAAEGGAGSPDGTAASEKPPHY